MINHKDLKPLQSMCAGLLINKRRLLLMLPRQEGKTELGIRCLRSVLGSDVSRSCIFLAKDRNSAKRASAEKFQRLFGDGFVVNTQLVYRKHNKSSVCYIESVDKDPDRIRGGTFFFVHWSEVAFSKFELGVTVDDVIGKVLMPTLRKTNGLVLMESTPNGTNGWYKLWHDYKTYSFSRLAISLSQMAEMGLVERDEYDKIKSETRPDVFRQEYECEFVSFAGRAYAELKREIHVRALPNPEHWQMVCLAIDWGFRPDATAILFAYIRDGYLCIFDEIYGPGLLLSHVADLIQAKIAHYKINSIAATADHDPRSIKELNLRGIPCGNADKVNVLGARLQIKELLFKNLIMIDPRCVNLLRDIESAEWDDRTPGDINYKLCSWGHFDCEAALRYLVREYSGFESERPTEIPRSFDRHSGVAWRLEWWRKKNDDDHSWSA